MIDQATVSAAARVLAKAPRRCKRDTATADLFGDDQPPAPPVAAATATTKRTATRRRGRPTTGEEGRDDGIARAARSSGDAWQRQALELVRVYACTHQRLTCDAARLWIASVGFIEAPPEPRAWGAVMRTAKRLGYLETTSEFVPSDDPATHCSPVRVWASLIYQPPGSTITP